MGLISAAVFAGKQMLADQWREYFYCNSMDSDTLVVKASKRTSKGSSNTKGSDNIISNGSIISVNEGQCMLIVDQGKVVELCATAGEFIYDTSTEPSIFYGNLGENISKSFATYGKRISFGGDTARDQRVYFVNTKPIIGNKYGTANPVPFRIVDNNIGLDIDISIRCNGEYSYQIENPLLFYTNVSGNVETAFTRQKIDSMLKAELLTALQPAFAKISAQGIRYSALPGHTTEIADALNEVLSAKWKELRGIVVDSIGVNSVSASKEDEDMIKELQRNAVLRNPNMAAATLAGAQAEAMKTAAGNKNGAMMGFMGMNTAQNVGGMNAQGLFQMGQQPTPPASLAAAPAGSWTCACGEVNTGKFCAECGAPKPAESGWTCPKCGSVNKGKFCVECGTKKPAGEPLYKCDKCGWEPEDPKHPPKFCPECGDRFDENDIQ